MQVVRNQAVHNAIQWDGDNTQEVLDFAAEWMPCWPPEYGTSYNPDTNQIVVCSGYLMNVGDWIVSAGLWPGTAYRDGNPEVVPNDLYQVKFSPVPETP